MPVSFLCRFYKLKWCCFRIRLSRLPRNSNKKGRFCCYVTAAEASLFQYPSVSAFYCILSRWHGGLFHFISLFFVLLGQCIVHHDMHPEIRRFSFQSVIRLHRPDYLQNIKLQIIRLRRRPEHRVIRRLSPGLDLTDADMRLSGSLAEHVLEKLPCNKVRAGAGREKAAVTDESHAVPVDRGVAARRIADVRL